MKRKIVAVWVSLAMLLGLIAIVDVVTDITLPVRATTLYVNTTGTGGAYTTIQSAINAANNGDTVFVYNGTYYENVYVNKTINLTGEDRDTTVINGSGINNCIHVTSNGANITRFTVVNSGINSSDAGIYVEDVQNCVIGNNRVLNNRYGIYLYLAAYNNVINNLISFNDVDGIYIKASYKGNIISGNIISNNTSDGIDINTDENIIQNNIISNNSGFGLNLGSSDIPIYNNSFINDGIYIWGTVISSFNNQIIPSNNSVNGKPIYYYKNTVGGVIDGLSAGQIILGECNNFIINNITINNTDVGIIVGFSNDVNISNSNSSNNRYSIYLIESTNSYIDSNILSYNMGGIIIRDSSSINITNNNISENDYATDISYSTEIRIMDNYVISNVNGIRLYQTSPSIIDNNTVSYNRNYGISLSSSPGSNITRNIMSKDGIFISGSSLDAWNTHNIDTANMLNNKPVYYFRNQTIGTIPPDAGQVILANCTNMTIENHNFIYVSTAIELGFSNYNEINHVNVTSNNEDGIYLCKSDWNNITYTSASSNDGDGIQLDYSNNNNILNSNFSANAFNGIYLSSSDHNNIKNCSIISNINHGVYSSWSDYTNITNNVIITNKNYGVNLIGSQYGFIHHNDFIANVNQAYVNFFLSNKWDNGYPSGGNYWSDYLGEDEYKGPNQDILGSDGIGDINYSIDSDTVDNYPLMNPIGNHLFLPGGWNLISIPFIQNSTSMKDVFSTISGLFNSVQWFNTSDSQDHWKHNNTSKPSILNDLSDIDHSMGFWIYITEPNGVYFRYPGLQLTNNQSIPLHPGWNMVGYPSLSKRNRTAALNNIVYGSDVDSIWTFDAATQTWQEIGPTDYFELGRGYWIHSKVTKTWDVPL